MKVLRYLPLLLMLLIQLLPLAVMGLTSFKTEGALLQGGPWAAGGFALDNYREVLLAGSFAHDLLTSGIIAVASALLAVGAAAAAAYALARWRFPGRSVTATAFLVSRLIPPVALALPVFLLLTKVHAVDTVVGLVLAHTSFNLPFAVWLLLPFFGNLPVAYEEAAAIDGCTPYQAFRLVVLPAAWPGLAVAAMFCFLASWNDFLCSLILAGSATKTAALTVNGYMTGFGPQWGPMTAASVLMLLPAFCLALVLQRHLVAGLTAGGIKD